MAQRVYNLLFPPSPENMTLPREEKNFHHRNVSKLLKWNKIWEPRKWGRGRLPLKGANLDFDDNCRTNRKPALEVGLFLLFELFKNWFWNWWTIAFYVEFIDRFRGWLKIEIEQAKIVDLVPLQKLGRTMIYWHIGFLYLTSKSNKRGGESQYDEVLWIISITPAKISVVIEIGLSGTGYMISMQNSPSEMHSHFSIFYLFCFGSPLELFSVL